MGLVFVLVAGPRHVVLPLALGATVLVSSYVFQVPRYWRIATHHRRARRRFQLGALITKDSLRGQCPQGG
jgi:hypothetical protein